LLRLQGFIPFSHVIDRTTACFLPWGLKNLFVEAFPKLQFLGKQPWIYGKKRALDRFFKSIS
jgi:hypothetical protein